MRLLSRILHGFCEGCHEVSIQSCKGLHALVGTPRPPHDGVGKCNETLPLAIKHVSASIATSCEFRKKAFQTAIPSRKHPDPGTRSTRLFPEPREDPQSRSLKGFPLSRVGSQIHGSTLSILAVVWVGSCVWIRVGDP